MNDHHSQFFIVLQSINMVVVASRQVPARLVVIRQNNAPFQVVHKHDATICRIGSPLDILSIVFGSKHHSPHIFSGPEMDFFMDFEHQRDGEASQKLK
jgi:hypothetical protein